MFRCPLPKVRTRISGGLSTTQFKRERQEKPSKTSLIAIDIRVNNAILSNFIDGKGTVFVPLHCRCKDKNKRKAKARKIVALIGGIAHAHAALRTNRVDYQSADPISQRLSAAKMDAGRPLAFDLVNNKVAAEIDGFPKVTGLLAVPEFHFL